MDLVNDYQCTCVDGYTGKNCSESKLDNFEYGELNEFTYTKFKVFHSTLLIQSPLGYNSFTDG